MIVDDAEQAERLILEGQSAEWKGKEKFHLTVGNLAGTRVQLNGLLIQLPKTGSNVVRNYLITRKELQTLLREERQREERERGKEDRYLYDQALQLAHGGKLPQARGVLEDFLRRFPTSPLADDAQYAIGETYFTERRYERAILEYDKVVMKYAKGDKVASAILKQGYAFLALGDTTSARILLTRVVDRYPDSPEAKEARSKLEGL